MSYGLRRRLAPFALALSVALVSAFSGPCASAQPSEIGAAAKAPGRHLLMRHALAPGTGDPAGFALGDCATQRNLSREGRAQAKAIGRALGEAGLAPDIVLTSQWCRASETASGLGLAAVEEEPALNSFFAGRGEAERQGAAVIARLKALDAAGRKAVLVTHQVNITALTDVFPASGEVLVVRLDGDRLSVEDRILIEP
ncbi:histidine phosphatase family protein [Aurantimonas sp. Leaf443]|uniref:histidine phosphatase family protein n=1 Tax=Aurantimonas sp. Leaf443 TaxID=1736378 RepID=UPI0006F295FF|nr:histidine phosphatase family protein [Aurantimonas sp. Leaf443]KQT85315.1 hypothetical protein ASG48_08675 [Aurantimonas sp. Leaf443]